MKDSETMPYPDIQAEMPGVEWEIEQHNDQEVEHYDENVDAEGVVKNCDMRHA